MKIQLDPGAFMPARGHSYDAGLDIMSIQDLVIPPNSGAVIHTGVHVEIPEGKCGLLVSKSGLNVKEDITTTGLIDCGYTGEIIVKAYNHSDSPRSIARGQKVTQLVILPCVIEDVEVVEKISGGERGDAGFGSTGK